MNAAERAWSVALCLLCAAPAVAQAPPLTGLTWTAPSGCIQTGELAQRVEDRLGRTTFATLASRHIQGQLRASELAPRWRAKLTLVDEQGTVLGSRELTGNDPRCRALDDSLVFILAVMIDPDVALRGPVPPATVEPAREASPEPAPPTPPPDVPLLRPRPPVAEPPPPARPRRIRLEDGRYYLGERELTVGSFYALVERDDLRLAQEQRSQLRIAGFTVGAAGVGASVVLLIAHALGVGCVRYSGTPLYKGSCLEGSPEVRTAGLIGLGVGAALLITAAVASDKPTILEEDLGFAEAFNEREAQRAHRM